MNPQNHPATKLSSRESGPLTATAVLKEVAAANNRGHGVVVATVIETTRSTPRRAGSKMIVRADGTTIGSVGGGEMEARVVAESLEALTTGGLRKLTYELVDVSKGDPGVCGGSVELLIEPHLPPPTLYIVGCGHVGRAVSDLAHWLGFRVVATDDRLELATPELMPSAYAVVAGSIETALAAHPIDHHTSVVLVTRNVALDVSILPTLLATPARYIGLMGSSRRWQTTRTLLASAGVSETDLNRISTPIGIEIKAETPEEIAVSVMAEVIADRRA